MADQNKFEKMLELLVNEDKEAAQELFHEIVVEKSRDIYESILEDETDVDEATDEEVEETTDEEVDEATDEEVDESDEEVEENFDLDSFEVEADDDMGPMDQTGDLANDLGMNMDDEGEEDEGEDGDMEDRVEDLEDALDDLKAEFEKMMAGDDESDDMDDEEEPEEEAFAFEATDEEVDEATDEEVDEATDEDDEVEESNEPQTAGEQMREYVEKVSATMGDNGANSKSTVANANDMGGTAANIAKGGEADMGGTGASAPKEDNAGNINKPGGKAAKAGKSVPGHGAEKKGKPETADNKKSMLGK